MGPLQAGLPADGSSSRSHRSKLRVVFFLIGVPSALVVLTVLALVLVWWVQLEGPSGSYIKSFDSSRVASEAARNKSELLRVLRRLPMAGQGFSMVASSYTDGCYPYDDDTFQSWQKVCYGRALYFYASPFKISETESRLTAVLSTVGWDPVVQQTPPRPCYGYPADILGNFRLGFVPDYEAVSLSAACPYSLSQTQGDTVATYAQSSVQYSKLTRTIDTEALIRKLAASGYQSYIAISVEHQYFDQQVGLYLFQ